jgi:hypothetical protein
MYRYRERDNWDIKPVFLKNTTIDWNHLIFMIYDDTTLVDPNHLPIIFDSGKTQISDKFVYIESDKLYMLDLMSNIQGESGKLVQKMNMAYIEYSKQYGHRNIHQVLPLDMRNSVSKLECRTNSLLSYLLESGEVFIVGGERMVPLDYFRKVYKQYCKYNGLEIHQLTTDQSVKTFSKAGVYLIHDQTTRMFLGKPYSGFFLKNLAALVTSH